MTTPADTYVLKIENTSPSDASMHLMGDFILEFSKMLGSKEQVHLKDIRDNCVALDATIEPKAIPAVRSSINRYRTENRSSYDRFDNLLRKHGSYAVLYDGLGNSCLEIPGIKRPGERSISLRQTTTVKGELVWIGGTSDNCVAHLKADESTTYKCSLSRGRAKEISSHLWAVFVVTGPANWVRDKNGKWAIQDYIHVKDIERLDDVSLGDTLGRLKQSLGDWSQTDDIEDLVSRIRDGS